MENEASTSTEEEASVRVENEEEPSTSSEKRNCPQNIKYEDVIACISFHPEQDCIAAGDMMGKIFFHSYSLEKSNNELLSLQTHKKALRGIEFSDDGKFIYSIAKDKTIKGTDMNQGKTFFKRKHEDPPYSLCVINENLVAVGDDEGTVKVWDTRSPEAIMSSKDTEEYISNLTIDPGKRVLLATSGEGTLTAYNWRSRKMDTQSELSNSDLLSVSVVKDCKKVIVGNGNGEIEFFNWKEFGMPNDKFSGHPDAIDRILPLTEDIVCTACRDGKVRALYILPNEFIGVVGVHGTFPVDDLDLSRCGEMIASSGCDEYVKFWSVQKVLNKKSNHRAKNTPKRREHALKGSGARNNFFDGFRK